MSSSKEEVINLVEYPSPTRLEQEKFWKRSNKISSPPSHNPSSAGKQSDVSNLFTVKKPEKNAKKLQPLEWSRPTDMESISTSELSDEVFETKHVSSTINKHKLYKDKIRDRFNIVKNKAGNSSQKARTTRNSREKLAIERVRRESNDVDAEIESVRSKFLLSRTALQTESDFFLKEIADNNDEDKDISRVSENSDKSEINLVKNVLHSPPELLKFNMKVSEKEWFFYPNKKPLEVCDKIVNDEPRFLEEEGFFVNEIQNIPRNHINLVEKRLLSVEDKKWFDCKGDMNVLQNPLVNRSIRPEIPKRNKNILSYSHATKIKQECTEIVIIRENILELQISTIKFTHHPLFSTEHVLEQKLIALFEEYKNSVDINVLQRLTNQLNALRHVRRNMEKLQHQSGDSEPTKIVDYNKEIKQLRNMLFEEGKKERITLKNILDTWKSIKKLRGINKYSNTKIKLLIKKEKVDFVADQQSHEKNLEDTLKEIIAERKTDYKKEMMLYKKDLEEFNRSESEDVPEKPLYNVDEEHIKLTLSKQFQESFRAPGEPVIKLLITYDNERSQDIENTKENTRRNVVTSTKLYLRIICNNLEVCKSKQLLLSDEFKCSVNETFSILLTNVPKYVTIEIIEQPKSLLKRKVCEMNLCVPPQNTAVGQHKETTETFQKSEIIHYKHDGVGSGVSLKTILEPYSFPVRDNLELNTSGVLQYSAGWDKVVEENTDGPITSLMDDIIEKTGGINVGKLNDWMTSHAPDPQDPRNSIFYEYTAGCDQDLPLMLLKKKDYFRLDPYIGNFQFCNLLEIEENIRLKILQLRNQNEIEFDGMVVPNRIKEIPFNVLADYRRRLAVEREGFLLEEDYDNVYYQRSYGNKFLKQVHTRVFQKCKGAQNNMTYEDVVDEKYLPYFEQLIMALLKNLFNWFRWQPKIMKSLPIARKSIGGKEHTYESTEPARLIFKIISAKNVPKRMRLESDDENKESDNSVMVEVQPYAEVSYNNISLRTMSNKGAHPMWNETLTVLLDSQHTDYLNPNSLNGTIRVNLFDEIDDSTDDRKLSNWLGVVEIPVSSVCHCNSMEGMFKVRLPHLLLGYETEVEKQSTTTPKVNNPSTVLSLQYTYLEMKINIEPNIPKLTPSMHELPCSDLPYIRDHLLDWNETFNNNFPNRKFSTLAIDTNAKTTCVIRYIKPLEPPQINAEEFDVTADQCARYVSLIPFTECNQFYQNVWLTTEQLLGMMIGSVIDHAVALTCYLLALKMDVWLLLGHGIPHGSTAYVLVKENVRESPLPVYYIYDVVYNEKHNLMDAYCPLQRIFCIMNNENLWANTQKGDDLTLMRFDLSRRGDWMPLFNNNIRVPTNSINMEITYKSKSNVEEIEGQIERKIKRKVAKLRQLHRTVWNHKISNAFKNALRMFELNTMYSKSNYETITELQKLMAAYSVNGHILNTPFTSVASIVKRVQSFGVHLQAQFNTEFALAVYMHPYDGQLLSLWLFIANLHQK